MGVGRCEGVACSIFTARGPSLSRSALAELGLRALRRKSRKCSENPQQTGARPRPTSAERPAAVVRGCEGVA